MYEKVTYYSRMSQTLHVPVPAAVPAAYEGPGDVVAVGWVGWYSPARAFKVNLVTQAVEIKFTGDNGVETYSTKTDGTVDYTNYAAHLAAHGGTPTINKLFDQTGNGNDLDVRVGSQTGMTFVENSLGSFPGMLFDTNGFITSTVTITQAQPLSFSLVAKATFSTGGGEFFIGPDDSSLYAAHGLAATEVWICYAGGAGSEQNSNVDLTNFHAGQFTLNGNNSNVYVDGVDSTTGANVGANGFVAKILSLGGGFAALHGTIIEVGLYGGSLFTKRSDLNNNQHNYYGF